MTEPVGTAQPGLIPQSNALSEASPESFAEYLNTNPERMDPGTEAGRALLKPMVEKLRKMYANWAQQEAQAKITGRKTGAKSAPPKLSGPIASEGLDF